MSLVMEIHSVPEISFHQDGELRADQLNVKERMVAVRPGGTLLVALTSCASVPLLHPIDSGDPQP